MFFVQNILIHNRRNTETKVTILIVCQFERVYWGLYQFNFCWLCKDSLIFIGCFIFWLCSENIYYAIVNPIFVDCVKIQRLFLFVLFFGYAVRTFIMPLFFLILVWSKKHWVNQYFLLTLYFHWLGFFVPTCRPYYWEGNLPYNFFFKQWHFGDIFPHNLNWGQVTTFCYFFIQLMEQIIIDLCLCSCRLAKTLTGWLNWFRLQTGGHLPGLWQQNFPRR